MKINVICDDGFKQVVQISKTTTARQVCEDICKTRSSLRIISVLPNECSLFTIDSHEILSSESAISTYIVFNANEVVDLRMTGFKAKEDEVIRLYETIAKTSDAVVVRNQTESNSSSNDQQSQRATPISVNQCCKEIISELEQSFVKCAKLLTASDARLNATKTSSAKNELLLNVLDALEEKNSLVVFKCLTEFLNPTSTSSVVIVSSPKVSQANSKKRDHDAMVVDAKVDSVVVNTTSNSHNRSPSPEKPANKKQNTNRTPVKPSVTEAVADIVISPTAAANVSVSIMSTPMDSPSRGRSKSIIAPTSTVPVTVQSHQANAVNETLPSVSNTQESSTKKLTAAQKKAAALAAAIKENELEVPDLFPSTQDSIFTGAMESVLASQGLSSVNNSQNEPKPKKLTATQKKAAALVAAASSDNGKAPTTGFTPLETLAEAATTAPVATRPTRTNSITSQSSVTSAAIHKATSKQGNKTVLSSTTNTPNAKSTIATKTTPTTKAAEPKSKISALLNADTQLFPIAEESSAVDYKSDNDSNSGYDTDDSANLIETEAEEKKSLSNSSKPEVVVPNMFVSPVAKVVNVKEAHSSESSSSSSESGNDSSSEDSDSSSSSDSDSDSESESDVEEKRNVLAQIDSKTTTLTPAVVSINLVDGTSSAVKEKESSSGESSSEDSSSSSSDSESDSDDSSSGSDSGSESNSEKKEKATVEVATTNIPVTPANKTPVPPALQGLLGSSVNVKPACLLPNTPANQLLMATTQMFSAQKQQAEETSDSDSEDSDNESETTRLEDKKPAVQVPKVNTKITKPVIAADKTDNAASNKRKATETVVPASAKKSATSAAKPSANVAASVKSTADVPASQSSNVINTRAKKTFGDKILEFTQANPNKTVTQSPTSSKVITVTAKNNNDMNSVSSRSVPVINLTQSSNITASRGGKAIPPKKKPKVAVIETSTTKKNLAKK